MLQRCSKGKDTSLCFSPLYLPKEVVESLSLEEFEKYVDVVLRNVVSGHGGDEQLDLIILVGFFNLNNSIILCIKMVVPAKAASCGTRTSCYLKRAV